jgi:anti-sigma regulatory factor (Ser/Thr protein kinase)
MPVCNRAERRLMVSRDAPQQARQFCADELRAVLHDSRDAGEVVDDVLVVVSELVTNAVNAAASNIVVGLDVHHAHLQLSVFDDAAGGPRPQTPHVDDEHGRGLQMVDSFALRWGVDDDRAGKQVWAIVGVPEAATAGMKCNVYALV